MHERRIDSDLAGDRAQARALPSVRGERGARRLADPGQRLAAVPAWASRRALSFDAHTGDFITR